MPRMNSAAASRPKFFAKTILVALFAAFICAGSFINIPLPGGVPVVVQDMFAMLSGTLLGPLYGAAAVLLFLALGCVGLPVFSGKAGLHIIAAGPTGGFLVGYLAGAIVGGLLLEIATRLFLRDKAGANSGKKLLAWAAVFAFVATLAATAVIFVFGIAGFMRVVGGGLEKALAICLLPFVPGNLIKLAASVPLIVRFRPLVQDYLRLQ